MNFICIAMVSLFQSEHNMPELRYRSVYHNKGCKKGALGKFSVFCYIIFRFSRTIRKHCMHKHSFMFYYKLCIDDVKLYLMLYV